jgi:ubiquinone/menaquinone biosynthesis C-methylase UbiE
MQKFNNLGNREAWIKSQLTKLSPGTSLLDVGAGECPYKPLCSHIEYTSQDVNLYDGSGNKKGLQTGKWNFDSIDIRCDLLDIPEDRLFDSLLCTEVLEHVPDPIRCLEKLTRLVKKPGGKLLITTPFCSLTHFAPYYYTNGFSEYFYRHHLDRLSFEVQSISFNGGWFDYMTQELGRTAEVYKQYFGKRMPTGMRMAIKIAKKVMQLLAGRERLNTQHNSSELLTCGLHVVAVAR